MCAHIAAFPSPGDIFRVITPYSRMGKWTPVGASASLTLSSSIKQHGNQPTGRGSVARRSDPSNFVSSGKQTNRQRDVSAEVPAAL